MCKCNPNIRTPYCGAVGCEWPTIPLQQPIPSKQQKVYDRVVKFMKDNDVTCEEAIYQTDHVIENAYEFMADLFKIVEPDVAVELENL